MTEAEAEVISIQYRRNVWKANWTDRRTQNSVVIDVSICIFFNLTQNFRFSVMFNALNFPRASSSFCIPLAGKCSIKYISMQNLIKIHVHHVAQEL